MRSIESISRDAVLSPGPCSARLMEVLRTDYGWGVVCIGEKRQPQPLSTTEMFFGEDHIGPIFLIQIRRSVVRTGSRPMVCQTGTYFRAGDREPLHTRRDNGRTRVRDDERGPRGSRYRSAEGSRRYFDRVVFTSGRHTASRNPAALMVAAAVTSEISRFMSPAIRTALCSEERAAAESVSFSCDRRSVWSPRLSR